MKQGTHPIHRKLLDHWIWQIKPFGMGQALVDLILLANHTESKAMIDGDIVIVKRGQVFRSQITLANKWGWSRKKVGKFLKLLKKDGMAEHQGLHHGTIITLCNYSKLHDIAFQGVTAKVTAKVTDKGQRGSSGGYTYNNDKNDKNVNNKENSLFERFSFLQEKTFKELWDAWLEVRKVKKVPNTDRALQIALNKLHTVSLEESLKMLEKAVEGGWKGVYPPERTSYNIKDEARKGAKNETVS